MARRNKINTTEKAYKEILKALNKYKSEIAFDVDDLERRAKETGAVCDSATQLDDGINKKLLDFVAGFKIGGRE